MIYLLCINETVKSMKGATGMLLSFMY